MSRPSETPWSNGLYAPQIPSWLYLAEKDWFAGYFIGVIFYGVLTLPPAHLPTHAHGTV